MTSTRAKGYKAGEPQGVRSASCSAFEAQFINVIADDPGVQAAASRGYLWALRDLEYSAHLMDLYLAGKATLGVARRGIEGARAALDRIQAALDGDEEKQP